MTPLACMAAGALWFQGLRLHQTLRPDPRPQGLAAPDFLLGVNLPWISYGNDFGANPWHPEGGVGAGEGPERLRSLFGRLADEGCACLRCFLLADGRSGIRTDGNGLPLGLDGAVLRDLDALIEAATRTGLRLIPVLWDFHLCRPAQRVAGTQTGGRSRWITDPGQRDALLDRVLDPILTHCGREPALWGWDLFNEPEGATCGLGAPRRGTVPPWAMRAFLRALAARVHARTTHPVTVGLASLRGLPLVRDLGLDVYQAHWYDRVERRAPLDRPVARLGLDRPLLLGEYPTRGSRRSGTEILDQARASGYAGALAWSLLAQDSASGLEGRFDPGEPSRPA